MAEQSNAPVILVGADAVQEQNRRLAEESRKLIESRGGKRLDETIPGGWFIGSDGVPHDAEGNKLDDESVRAAAKEKHAAQRVAELERELAALKSKAALEAGVGSQAPEGLTRTAFGTLEGVSKEAREAGEQEPPDEGPLGVKAEASRPAAKKGGRR